MKKLLFFVILVIIGSIALYQSERGNANPNWTEETTKKLSHLVRMGVPHRYARALILECKAKAKDPVKCIKLHVAIIGAESTLAKNCYRNNCFGLGDGTIAYRSIEEGIQDWVKRYNIWWYKQKDPSGFYRNDGTKPPTRYCMGTKRDGVCKDGFRNAWDTWKKINF